MLPEPRPGDDPPDPATTAVPTRDPERSDGLTVAPSQPRAGLLLVRVLGDLDLRSAERYDRVLRAAVAAAAQEHRSRAEHPKVVCDLAGLTFLGAAGLTTLLEIAEHARDEGVELVLVVGEGRIRRQLVLTGVDRTVPLATHLAEALDTPALPPGGA